MDMLRKLSFLLLLSFVVTYCCGVSVDINVYSKWSHTPLHLEASEWLARENHEYFWSYIRNIHEKFNVVPSNSDTNQTRWTDLTPSQQYEHIIELADDILDEAYQLPLLKLSLSLRAHSPALAAHEQIARDRLGSRFASCRAYLEWPQPPLSETGNSDSASDDQTKLRNIDFYAEPTADLFSTTENVNIVCNSNDASLVYEKIMSTNDPLSTHLQATIYKTDHVYYAHNNPKGKEFKIITPILYGEIGTPEFAELYDYVKKLADSGRINFVVRHLPLTTNTRKSFSSRPRSEERVSLAGYGVELAIKSTEYRAQDDMRVKGEAISTTVAPENTISDTISDFAVDSELTGLASLSKIDHRGNDKLDDNEISSDDSDGNESVNVDEFRRHVRESINQVPTFETEELANMSFSAIALLMAVKDPLERFELMRDISQNLPIIAKSLIKSVKFTQSLRSELERNHLMLARYLRLAPTDTSIFMSGMFIDVDAMDIFAFTDIIRNELREMSESSSYSAEGEADVERFINQRYSDTYLKWRIPAMKPHEPHLKLQVIIDPLSRAAQKITPILLAIRQAVNIEYRILFNCWDKLTEMPLNNFYRYVLNHEPRFSDDGTIDQASGGAHFGNAIPKHSLLTLNMATPENWLVEAVKAQDDLDNLHLAASGHSVSAEFELEHLLLEGHCFDMSTGNPPRGLQFVLGTRQRPTLFDTIVMANLGYFQLKASPGAWNLRLRHGPSAEIYQVLHVDGADFVEYQDPKLASYKEYVSEGSKQVGVPALIKDFRSRFMKVRVSKRREQRHRDLLDAYSDDDYESDTDLDDQRNKDSQNGDDDMWGSIRKSVWSGSAPTSESPDSPVKSTTNSNEVTKKTSESNRINVFSLASGHLYERLARIMMLSVLKNTNTPVKFWFLKNYLSPRFKDFLPHLSRRYKFDYELVQYKWPRWLHQQTEKQRIIWGYKILFLDVLFPLDVKKIIFVDADQVVRADLKELRDLPLDGAPYGYTPFCDSRHDMDGFRFWKQGYWQTHLHGRKYHISALYVVDLVKFRRIAAGDRLRGQYQGLSQDPNSLSNLDQDLPNNMIHQVPIKSLPQEWLWCETWCDDESKALAKTIDLCNNPKTKEPKLTSARRIIAEWQDYDDEINEFYNSIMNNSSAYSTNETETNVIDGSDNVSEPSTTSNLSVANSTSPDDIPSGTKSEDEARTSERLKDDGDASHDEL
ncbi:UDP-glucose:glycoprotein glucosyltransferase, partial [Fragariocoptes setiger]